jgi:XTP/dITP diphosphohydrolase
MSPRPISPSESGPGTLVLASRNREKLAELNELLVGSGLVLVSAADLPDLPEIAEGATSFADNAALKAVTVSKICGKWALGDDSGLVVDTLDGAPGVLSSRYAGSSSTSAENNARLLEALRDVPDARRTAHFACHLAVADPQGAIRLTASGKCHGRILRELRGAGGFGYDPLFWIPEYGRTFGELSPTAKNVLSHRARAMYQLLPRLRRLLRS